jgi:glycine hydroxymethyltransferase
MGEAEMRQIALWMDQVIAAPNDEELADKVRAEVAELCRSFPAPGLLAR